MRIGVHQHIRRSVSCGALNGLHIAARDHQLIGGHWNGADRERRCGETPGVRPAIRDLMPGTKRFGELKKSIGHVTQKVLTAQLRQEESRINKRRGAVHLCSTPSFICVHLRPAYRAAPNRGASGWRQPPHPGGSRRNSGSIEFVPIEILRTVDFGNLL